MLIKFEHLTFIKKSYGYVFFYYFNCRNYINYQDGIFKYVFKLPNLDRIKINLSNININQKKSKNEPNYFELLYIHTYLFTYKI